MVLLAGLIPHEAPRPFLSLCSRRGNSPPPASPLSLSSLSDPRISVLRGCSGVEAAQSHCTCLPPGLCSIQMCRAQHSAVLGSASSCAQAMDPYAELSIQLCRIQYPAVQASPSLDRTQDPLGSTHVCRAQYPDGQNSLSSCAELFMPV